MLKKFHLKFTPNSQAKKGGRKSDSSFTKKRIANKKIAYINSLIENVDQLVIIASLKDPFFSSDLIDRFLILAALYNKMAVLIITKTDLTISSDLEKVLAIYKKITLPIWPLSNLQLTNKDKLKKEIFEKKISAVVGHSGVGKTTLLNQIDHNFKQKVQKISSFTHKGKHTTTKIRRHEFYFSGVVYDMPGLKEIDYINLNKKELKNYYPEFKDLKDSCHFKNCIHEKEPNCQIKKSLAEGTIHAQRYKNYINILNSLEN